MAVNSKKITRSQVEKWQQDFATAKKNFDSAYAKLRRFLDKQKLNALRQSLSKK